MAPNMSWWKKFRWDLLSESEKFRKIDNVIEKSKIELDEVEANITSRKIQIIKACKEAREAIPDIETVEDSLAVDLREKLEIEIDELKVARRAILDRIFEMEKIKMELREKSTQKARSSCGTINSKRRRENPTQEMSKLKKEHKGWTKLIGPIKSSPNPEKKPSPSAPETDKVSTKTSSSTNSSGFGSTDGFGNNNGFGNANGFSSNNNDNKNSKSNTENNNGAW